MPQEILLQGKQTYKCAKSALKILRLKHYLNREFLSQLHILGTPAYWKKIPPPFFFAWIHIWHCQKFLMPSLLIQKGKKKKKEVKRKGLDTRFHACRVVKAVAVSTQPGMSEPRGAEATSVSKHCVLGLTPSHLTALWGRLKSSFLTVV